MFGGEVAQRSQAESCYTLHGKQLRVYLRAYLRPLTIPSSCQVRLWFYPFGRRMIPCSRQSGLRAAPRSFQACPAHQRSCFASFQYAQIRCRTRLAVPHGSFLRAPIDFYICDAAPPLRLWTALCSWSKWSPAIYGPLLLWNVSALPPCDSFLEFLNYMATEHNKTINYSTSSNLTVLNLI